MHMYTSTHKYNNIHIGEREREREKKKRERERERQTCSGHIYHWSMDVFLCEFLTKDMWLT